MGGHNWMDSVVLLWKGISFFNVCILINFYWSIVDLPCCVSFRCTAKWISYTYRYIHSFLDSIPIMVITEYWVSFPVLYSRSLLFICFICSNIYVNPKLLIYVTETKSLLIKYLVPKVAAGNRFLRMGNWLVLWHHWFKSRKYLFFYYRMAYS